MKKIENVEVMGWEAAIRGMPAKGYRKTKGGKFECFVSEHSKNISLGTYGTEELAKQAVFEYRIARFKNVEVYIVVSANSYEMASGEQCLDVWSGKYITFEDYEDYRRYILKTRARKKQQNI